MKGAGNGDIIDDFGPQDIIDGLSIDDLSSVGNGQMLDEIDPQKFLDDFMAAKPEYNKAVDDYKKALEKINSEEYNLNSGRAEDRFQDIASDSSTWAIAGKVLCIAAALLTIATAAVTVYDIYKYYHKKYVPIPRKIVHESSDEKGRSVYTVYDVTFCNREDQGFGNETLGSYGDMNGDVGKQWLALYTTKDKAAGDPITANIIAQKGSSKMPADKATGIKLFGKTDTVNLVSEDYCYNDKHKGLYIFSGTNKTVKAENTAAKTDSSTPAADSSSQAAASSEDASSRSDNKAAGSVVGTGTMALSCVGSASIGALIVFFILRRKKGDNAAA